MSTASLLSAHRDHNRSWRDFYYVYPVISRRAGGLSIGINLNPDKKCNFDCAYCSVDRTTPGRIKEVDLAVLAQELESLLGDWKSGRIFEDPFFAEVPISWRRLNDIAFSGDGEPTTCPVFEQAVQLAFELRGKMTPPETKLILITDAACLDRAGVQAGLRIMMGGAHDVWAKLDAGTPDYFRQVNRTSIPFERITKNITATAAWCPLWIQTLFARVHDQPPPEAEVAAYLNQLDEIRAAGGTLLGVQLYTVARKTPEAWITALADEEIDMLAARVRDHTGLPVVVGYGDGAL